MKLTFISANELGVLKARVEELQNANTAKRSRGSMMRNLSRALLALKMVQSKDGPVHYLGMATDTGGDIGAVILQDSNQPTTVVDNASLPGASHA